MALSTCLALGYTYSESFCLEIDVDQGEDKFTANTNWIIGAFFLGAIVGSGLVLLLTKPFLNAWQKKKVQDEEGILQATTDSNIIKGKQLPVGKENSDSKEQKVSFRASRFRRNVKKSELSKTKEQNPSAKVEVDPSQSRGMVDVLLQTTNNTAEVEMADQDMSAIVAMERSMEEEKEMMLLHILSMLMKIKMDEKQMTKAFYLNFVKKTGEDLDELNTIIEQEKEAAEEKLRNDPKLSKDSQTLESEMQKLQTDYNHKQAKLQRDFKDKIRLDLLRSSGMPEAEVENLMLQLMNEMAAVEEKLGLEQARQRRALEHRLARRRQAIEYKEAEEMETQSESDKRVLFFDDILSTHLKGASKLEGQRDEIIASFKSDLNEIQKFYSKESESMKLEKSDNLQNLRLTSFHKLTKKQEKEKALFLATADKKNSLRDFIKLYHDLIVKHHMEQELLDQDLDQNEVQETHEINQVIAKKESEAMQKAVERQTEKLEDVLGLTASEADKIIRLHKMQMEDYNARCQKARQATLVQLQEKLKQRMVAADEAEARDQKEQEVLKQEQMATMTRVLSTNMELSDEAKKRILREHEQNMQVLSNQLLRSKLRQRKSLEIKLNQRKTRLAELQKQQRELRSGKEDDSETKLAKELAKEEEAFEEARQEAVAELRRQLAKETEEALKLHDDEIGLLIGRLQVGQARRKAILKKQDATLRGLQEQFENRLLTDKSLPTNMTSQIIQEHYNKVTHINDQMQKRREMQQRFIMEKLESKRVELEEQVESQLERDAQEEYTERQKKGAGYASLALMQTFLEQKHAKAMLDLESEMHAELEKSKSELNIQLEQELLHELESRSKEFLQHLASVSKMSKEDLKEAVSAATSGHPRSQAVERLAKDLRQGVETDYAERKRKPSANDRPYSGTASSDLRREWSGKASSQRRSSQLSREEYDDNYGTF